MSQSPELAAGEGFDFEDVVAAFYLTKILAEDSAQGIDGGKVVQVGVQQRDFGEPLDDVIVDFEVSPIQPARLSLQAKQSLTISAAKTNDAFREIVRDSWRTLQKDDFREDVDRFGGATEKIASGAFEDLKSLCELARGSLSTEHFKERFSDGGNASKAISEIRDVIRNLLTEQIGRPVEDQELHRFLKHFIILRFDLMREGASDRSGAVNSIRRCFANESSGSASLVWERFRTLAGEKGGKSGQLNRFSLLRVLGSLVKLKGASSMQQDAQKIEGISRNHLAQIQDGIGDVQLERPNLIEFFEGKIESHRFLQIRGLPGVGKSVFLRRLVQKAMANGLVIFLKSEEIKCSSWIQFSQAHGIETTDLKTFLLEFGTMTEPVLYLDAIDRLDSAYQPLIREILGVISTDEDLGCWKVVVSLRDTGIEALHLWLGDILDRARFGTMEVELLSDEEAETLAEKKPYLRSILFGAEEVRKIVRRPFFAKILDQGFDPEKNTDLQKPKSEVELLENWWNRGGYNPVQEKVLRRPDDRFGPWDLEGRNVTGWIMAFGNESPNPGPREEVAKMRMDIVSVAIRSFQLGVAPMLDVMLGQRVEISLPKSLADHPGLTGGIVSSPHASSISILLNVAVAALCHCDSFKLILIFQSLFQDSSGIGQFPTKFQKLIFLIGSPMDATHFSPL